MLLFWFRRDLRLHDNVGLYHALKSGYKVLPVFIFDTDILDLLDDRSDARVTFIYDTIKELHQKLEKKGSTLLVRYGKPNQVFEALIKEYPEIKGVYTNHDYEPYAQERDKGISKLFYDNGLEFKSFKDQVIFERDEIMTKSNTPYKVYTPYKNTWKKALKEEMYAPFPSDKNLIQLQPHKASTLITLKQMGFSRSSIEVPAPNLKAGTLEQYEETRNLPALDATTRISPHLRFGTVSVREVVKLGLKHSDTWLQELIWREFFMQLLYHYPNTVNESFAPKFRHISWRNNEEEFEKWCSGKTGFPLVDAGMRELNQTGFMHNRVRMVTASFLIKDLLIDWRWGEAYFAEKLLDYEMASNVGNWQWAAGTGADAQPYFRVFNPDSQIKRFDKDYKYIKRWVPEYGTSDYPEPIVNHADARDRAIAAYKKSISQTE